MVGIFKASYKVSYEKRNEKYTKSVLRSQTYLRLLADNTRED